MRADHVLGDRFELLARLGAGGMGDVYRARDRAREQDIAIKVLPELDATALTRFKHEFRALHDVAHPNLVRLHELHEHRGTWFFTMQLIEGADVLAWVGGDAARLRQVLPQIARALHRLHDRGLVHRDVKPSNILVTGDGTAILLDFGLVAPTWSPGEGAGTPAYMAPEQAAGDISPAADWYALGVIVFRALTGRMPFAGAAGAILRAKASGPAPAVTSVRPSAPRDLAALADAMLARRPQDRPSGAAILAALGEDRERAEVASLLVGRDRELAELHRAFADRIRGAAFAVAVIGESGIGKTSLLRTFAEDLDHGGTWVLQGRAWERETVPYKGFDGVIDDLVALLEGDPLALDAGGWAAILVQAFPVLQRLPAFAGTELVLDVGGRETAARVSSGVRWLLSAIAEHRPIVVVIDDLQWADRDTLALLRGMLEPALPNVLLVVGAREPIAIDPRVALRTIELSALTLADTTTLVARVGGAAIDATAIAKEAGGHPLLAAELARHAAATGEVGPIAFDAAVRAITERLGDAAARVATIVSVAHGPIAASDAAAATGLPAAAFFEGLAALRAAQVIATTGVASAMRLEPSHDRIRRVFAAASSPAIHAAIADALERGGSADPEAIALHHADAGQPATAAGHALRAAEQAEAALAFHRAARLYRWVGALDPARSEVRVRYAECLAQAGLGVDAADAYLACADEATGTAALDLRRRAMQQLMLMGHHARALELFGELARELAIPNPSSTARLVAGLVAHRLVVRLRTPELPDRPPGSMRDRDRVRLDVIFELAAGHMLFDPLRAFYFHSVNLETSLRIGDSSRIARALLAEVPYLAAAGAPSRRLDRLVAQADLAAQRAAFPALSHLVRGTIGFCFGTWRTCGHDLDRAERLLLQERPRLVAEGAGSAQLLDLTRRFQLVSQFYLGQLDVIERRMPDLLLDALERNDIAAATHLRSGIQTTVHLAFDRVDVAVRDADEAFRPWRHGRPGVPLYMDLCARAAVALYRGDGVAAYRVVRDAWGSLVRAGLMRVQYLRISLLDVRGRAALAAGRRDDAMHCARRLDATGARWGRGLAAMLRARSPAELAEAARTCDAADLALHAAVARRCAGAGDGALHAMGVVDIERFARVLLPQ